ncbi:MAG: hypothetical protein U1E36_00270 [Rickettsiales bacterium]
MEILKYTRKLLAGKNLKDTEEWLRFNMSMSDAIIAAVFFSAIFFKKLKLKEYFGSDAPEDIATGLLDKHTPLEAVLLYLHDMGHIAALAGFTFLWYFLYKQAVHKEIGIAANLFSRFNPPHDWKKMIGYEWVPFISIGLTVAFIGLAWYVDKIQVYILIVLITNVIDIRGNSVVRQTLIHHFADPAYLPLEADLHKEFIMRRRAVAEEYWIKKPQLERIGLMIIGNVAAFVALFSEQIFGVALPIQIPYAMVVFVIAANEIIMFRWRKERDKAINKIEDDEEEANRKRTKEEVAHVAKA